jgi:hypothetical protein
MPKILLVLRASADWTTFDLEHSRDFLKSLRLPEDLVIEFAAIWDRHFKLDYRGLRAELKVLALESYHAVRQATLVRHQEWDGIAPPDGRVAFVDDDDWMAPGLFEELPVPTTGEDGTRWGSLRLGRIFAPHGYDEPIIQRRPLDHVIYTNNYAVTSSALYRLGRAAFFEHDAAQISFDLPGFKHAALRQYLSCTVKHPCSTMSVNFLMSRTNFRADPRREMADFMATVDAMPPHDTDEWLRRPFSEFRRVMADAVRPR